MLYLSRSAVGAGNLLNAATKHGTLPTFGTYNIPIAVYLTLVGRGHELLYGWGYRNASAKIVTNTYRVSIRALIRCLVKSTHKMIKA